MSWVKINASISLLLPCVLMAHFGGLAQERDSIPPVAIGGFVDSYYSWNGARPASHVNRLRNFDLTEHQFVLSEAQVDIERRPAPIGFHIALNTGAASDIITWWYPVLEPLSIAAYVEAWQIAQFWPPVLSPTGL